MRVKTSHGKGVHFLCVASMRVRHDQGEIVAARRHLTVEQQVTLRVLDRVAGDFDHVGMNARMADVALNPCVGQPKMSRSTSCSWLTGVSLAWDAREGPNSAKVRFGEPSGVNWDRTPNGLLNAMSTRLKM